MKLRFTRSGAARMHSVCERRVVRARQRDQPSLGAPVEGTLVDTIGRRSLQRGIETLQTEPLPHPPHGGDAGVQRPDDAFVGPSVGTVGVGLQEDAGPGEHPGGRGARGEELEQALALFVGEPDDVPLVHGGPPL